MHSGEKGREGGSKECFCFKMDVWNPFIENGGVCVGKSTSERKESA